jgi:2-polyprenyl-6-hydroxyphenyl methylase/3-demethylubiquinone-9 3-methyltransferase
MADRAPAQGLVADVGCGHGVLSAALALGSPQRRVVGVDPDERKIALARQALASLPNVELRAGTAESLLPELEGACDAVVVADVLYLLPFDLWADFLRTCRRLLKPGGLLLLKEAEADRRSWKYWKCVAQEAVMVRLLRKTRSSGGLGFRPREELASVLAGAGFHVGSVEDVSRGYTTPHVLFTATALSPGSGPSGSTA